VSTDRTTGEKMALQPFSLGGKKGGGGAPKYQKNIEIVSMVSAWKKEKGGEGLVIF